MSALDEMKSRMVDIERGRLSPSRPKPYVAVQLEEKANLFSERAAVYGDNYKRHGAIVAQLMATQSLDPTDVDAMNRFGVLTQIVSKITRYAENFNRGGHDDSLDDIAVYAMMLKQLDNGK